MDNHVKCIVIGNRTGTCASVEMLKGYTLICRNAVGVHGKRKVGNPWSRRATQNMSATRNLPTIGLNLRALPLWAVSVSLHYLPRCLC